MKNVKSRLAPLLVTVMLLLSMVALFPQTVTAAGANIVGTEADTGICGQEVWINISGLQTGTTRPHVYINFTTELDNSSWVTLKKTRGASDGTLNATVNIPHVNQTGTYYFNVTNASNPGDYDTKAFIVTSIYDIVVTPNPIIWDQLSQPFNIKIYKWDGSSYGLLDSSVAFYLYDPAGEEKVNNSGYGGNFDTYAIFNYTTGGNRETNYTLNITSTTDETDVFAMAYVPVRLQLEDVSIEAAVYNDAVTVMGKLVDNNGDPVTGYTGVTLLSPNGTQTPDVTTTSAGTFSIAVVLNEAGTWYIGTNKTGDRPTDEETTKGETDFIWYDTIEVEADTGTISVNPTETTYGFNFTLNIEVLDGDGDPVKDAWVNVTGLECVFNGVTGDADNFTILGKTNETGILPLNHTTAGQKFRFTESGTATFGFEYGNTSTIDALISGTTTMAVLSPGPMNVFIEFDAEKVLLGEIGVSAHDPPGTYEEWANWTSPLNITVYGRSLSDEMKNVSITISGCGIDQEIEEADQGSGYQVNISPRNGGILTVTVHNESEDLTVSKDIQISGLVSEATTSIGDDKEITVNEPETVTFTVQDSYWSEVYVTMYDQNWNPMGKLNNTVGDKTEGNGLNGIYTFLPDCDVLGYMVFAASVGAGSSYYYTYDIVEVVPKHDLVVTILEPDAENLTLTAGVEYDIEVAITNLTGYELTASDVDSVVGQIIDEEGDVVVDCLNFSHDSGNVHTLTWAPNATGTLLITATAFNGEHDGNNSDLMVDYAVFTYDPPGLTCGIELVNQSVLVTAVDAEGNPLTETQFWMNKGTNFDSDVSSNSSNPLELDENGQATIWFDYVGDNESKFYATLVDANTSDSAAMTEGQLDIIYPIFVVDPETVFIGQANTIAITAKDVDGNPIPNINISLVSSIPGILAAQPDPVKTDSDGMASLSIQPLASGYLNVTIARNIAYEGGQLNWTDAVITDTTIMVTAIKQMEVTVSESPIHEGDSLVVTVTETSGAAISGASVKFGQQTSTTDATGKATFTAPDPGVESALYTVTATKSGYVSASASVTVLKVYTIQIVAPSAAPKTGESFSVTVLVKGGALAGATVTFNGKTATSGTDGKATFTAPSEAGAYTVTAAYEGYEDGTGSVTVEAGGIPGFEMVTLVAALGVCFILLRRRK